MVLAGSCPARTPGPTQPARRNQRRNQIGHHAKSGTASHHRRQRHRATHQNRVHMGTAGTVAKSVFRPKLSECSVDASTPEVGGGVESGVSRLIGRGWVQRCSVRVPAVARRCRSRGTSVVVAPLDLRCGAVRVCLSWSDLRRLPAWSRRGGVGIWPGVVLLGACPRINGVEVPRSNRAHGDP